MPKSSRTLSRLVSAWPQVAKRSLAHWRLLSSVIVGVLLASAIMAGTVIYFDSLRELALENTVARISSTEKDILLRGDRGPTTNEEYLKVSTAVNRQIDSRISWLLADQIVGRKTDTFFLTQTGDEGLAGEDNARTYFAFLPRLLEHVTVLPGGSLPRELPAGTAGEPLVLEALIPVEAAELFQVGVGDRLSAVPYWSDATTHAIVIITGIFERDNPADDFWLLDDRVFKASTRRSFRAAPFYVTERTFLEALGGSFRDMDSTYGWHLVVDPTRLSADNAASTLAHLRAMEGRLSSDLFSYRQISSLDEALQEYDDRLFFSKLPMFIILILIAVVILYYVVTLSSLLVEQQRGDVALLRSRGASSAQILAVFALEGGTISILAIALAPVLAAAVISLLGYTPAFSGLSGSSRLPVALSGGAYMMSALGGLLSFVALMIPAVQASRIGVTRHRQQAARPSEQLFFQRYYLDVMLLAVSVLLFRQLSQQGSVLAVGLFGKVAENQLLLAVPALTLVAASLVLLRIFPLALMLASRLLSPVLPAGPALGLWQMSRNPTHYARFALLIMLMAGLGIFAASFGSTLERSFEDRVLYSTGADIRLEGVQLNTRGSTVPLVESYESMPGVDRASQVFRGHGTDLSEFFGETYMMFAPDSQLANEIGWFRDDFSDKPMRELLRALPHPSPPTGIGIPVEASAIRVTVKADRPHPSVLMTARIRDANDRHFTYYLGNLAFGDWVALEANLERERRSRLQPTRPLTLVSLSIHEVDGQNRLNAGSLLIDDIRTSMPDNTYRILEPFDDVSGWNTLRAVPQSIADALQSSNVSFDGSAGSADGNSSAADGNAGSAVFIWTEGGALTSRGIYYGPPMSPLSVLASESFLRDTGHVLGEEFVVSVAGRRIPITVIDAIDYFPTLDTINERYLIADLASLSRYANLETTIGELRPNEMWLSTNGNEAQRIELLDMLDQNEPFSNGLVHDRVISLAQSQVDPLVNAGWRALLFMAFAAVLILSGLGFLVHTYVSFRSREVQFALMRTIGVSMKQLVTLVWLEQVLVIGAGMALGTWMGGRIGAIFMPYLGHDDRGSQVLPPFVVQVDWGTLAITYAAMALVFTLIIAGVIWFIRGISLQRGLRLGEM